MLYMYQFQAMHDAFAKQKCDVWYADQLYIFIFDHSFVGLLNGVPFFFSFSFSFSHSFSFSLSLCLPFSLAFIIFQIICTMKMLNSIENLIYIIFISLYYGYAMQLGMGRNKFDDSFKISCETFNLFEITFHFMSSIWIFDIRKSNGRLKTHSTYSYVLIHCSSQF